MLKMESVTKTFSHRTQAVTGLNDVTFEILKNDYISIVGPSGSGKSTLLLALGGMLSPSEGKVILEGQSLYDLGPDQRAEIRRHKIGFVFQTFNLVPYLTALENVQIPLMVANINESDQEEKAKYLLERVGLEGRSDHKPSELSVGQQQRVALARVLANDPEIILADEPTGNLDPDTGRQIIAFFDEMHQEGKTIVMVTHDPHMAKRTKRTFRLVEGRVLPDNGFDPEEENNES